jgi:acetyltransferase-like isoleucine patch superfamily enzyme
VSVGDNSIIGATAVVSKDVPANAVVAGVPARVVRMREAPQTLKWSDPVEP